MPLILKNLRQSRPAALLSPPYIGAEKEISHGISAQFEANRLNAAASTGPTSPEGKVRSSRNHLKFGLFSAQNCVRPEEAAEYTKLSKALWKDLNPVGTVEEMLAVEIVRAAWRLHRCAVAEAENGGDPATQTAVDRARVSAHNSIRRFLNDLRQFQSDRWLRAEVLRDGFDEQYIGIADAHRVIKGLADNERLKAQFLMAPIASTPSTKATQQFEPNRWARRFRLATLTSRDRPPRYRRRSLPPVHFEPNLRYPRRPPPRAWDRPPGLSMLHLAPFPAMPPAPANPA